MVIKNILDEMRIEIKEWDIALYKDFLCIYLWDIDKTILVNNDKINWNFKYATYILRWNFINEKKDRENNKDAKQEMPWRRIVFTNKNEWIYNIKICLDQKEDKEDYWYILDFINSPNQEIRKRHIWTYLHKKQHISYIIKTIKKNLPNSKAFNQENYTKLAKEHNKDKNNKHKLLKETIYWNANLFWFNYKTVKILDFRKYIYLDWKPKWQSDEDYRAEIVENNSKIEINNVYNNDNIKKQIDKIYDLRQKKEFDPNIHLDSKNYKNWAEEQNEWTTDSETKIPTALTTLSKYLWGDGSIIKAYMITLWEKFLKDKQKKELEEMLKNNNDIDRKKIEEEIVKIKKEIGEKEKSIGEQEEERNSYIQKYKYKEGREKTQPWNDGKVSDTGEDKTEEAEVNVKNVKEEECDKKTLEAKEKQKKQPQNNVNLEESWEGKLHKFLEKRSQFLQLRINIKFKEEKDMEIDTKKEICEEAMIETFHVLDKQWNSNLHVKKQVEKFLLFYFDKIGIIWENRKIRWKTISYLITKYKLHKNR